jgi:hypothetical protein
MWRKFWRCFTDTPSLLHWVPEPHHSTQRGVYVNYALLERLRRVWAEE